MKSLLSMFILSLLFISGIYAGSKNEGVWFLDYEKAYETAKKENKVILLFFTKSRG